MSHELLKGLDLQALGLSFSQHSTYLNNTLAVVEEKDTEVFGIDMSIEGLRSQKYSVGIFGFLVFSVILFAFIIYLYMPKGEKSLKTGEKIMIGAIVIGIFVAVGFGWLQLIEGYLF